MHGSSRPTWVQLVLKRMMEPSSIEPYQSPLGHNQFMRTHEPIPCLKKILIKNAQLSMLLASEANQVSKQEAKHKFKSMHIIQSGPLGNGLSI